MTRILNWELTTGEMGTGHKNVTLIVHRRMWRRWSDLPRATEQHLVLAELVLTLNNSWLLVLCSLTRRGWTTRLLPTTPSRCQPLHLSTFFRLHQNTPSEYWQYLHHQCSDEWYRPRREDQVLCVSPLICLALLKVHLSCRVRCWLCLSPPPWSALVNLWKSLIPSSHGLASSLQK